MLIGSPISGLPISAAPISIVVAIYATPQSWAIVSRAVVLDVESRAKSFSVSSRLKAWNSDMGFPLLGQRLDPVTQGDNIAQPITLTVSPGTVADPNTWTSLRFSITAKNGQFIEVGLGDMSAPTITGNSESGWVVTCQFPIDLSLVDDEYPIPVGMAKFQIDYAANSLKAMLIGNSFVEILAPSQPF